jgi:hypothetical protein
MEGLNRDHIDEMSTAQNRREGADDIVDFIEKTESFSLFTSEEKKKDFLNSLTAESAISLLDQVHGIMTQTAAEERGEISHPAHIRYAAHVIVYIPPMQSLQSQLLDKVILPHIKEMSTDDAAIYSSLCINLMHRYPDGNGRLARLVYALLASDNEELNTPEGKDHLKLGIINRYRLVNCDPDLIAEEVNHYLSQLLRPEALRSDKAELLIVNSSTRQDAPTEEHADRPVPETEVAEAAELDLEGNNFERNKERLQSLAEEDPVDFELGVMYYIDKFHKELAEDVEKKEDEDAGAPGAAIQPSGKKRYVINIDKVFESLQTDKDCQLLFNSRQMAKGMRFVIIRKMITEPNRYPSMAAPHLTVKDLLRHKIYRKYSGYLSGEAQNMNFTM